MAKINIFVLAGFLAGAPLFASKFVWLHVNKYLWNIIFRLPFKQPGWNIMAKTEHCTLYGCSF